MPAANDPIAGAITLNVGDRVSFDLTDATKESGETNANGWSDWASVWYTVTPTVTTLYAFVVETTGSDPAYPNLAVYSGTGFPLTSIWNSNGEQYSQGAGAYAFVTLTAGTTYYVQIADSASVAAPSAMHGTITALTLPPLLGDTWASAPSIPTGTSSDPMIASGPSLLDINGTGNWSGFWVIDYGAVSWPGGAMPTIPAPTETVTQERYYVLVGDGSVISDLSKDNTDNPALTPYYYSQGGFAPPVVPAGTYRLLQYLLHLEQPAGTDNRWAWPLTQLEIAWLNTAMAGATRAGVPLEHGVVTNMRTWGATNEAGEPAGVGGLVPRSIWRKFTAPSSGRFVFQLRPEPGNALAKYEQFNAVMEAWTGSSLGSLVSAATAVTVTPTSTTWLSIENAVVGTDYYIRVYPNTTNTADYESETEMFVQMTWGKYPRPVNDNAIDATALDITTAPYGGLSSTLVIPYDNSQASVETGEYAGPNRKSLWWKITPAKSGAITVKLSDDTPWLDPPGTNIYNDNVAHYIDVWMSDSVGATQPITNLYSSNVVTWVTDKYGREGTINAVAGTTYWIRVAMTGFSSGYTPVPPGGPGTLMVSAPTPTPAKTADVSTNDNFINRYKFLLDHQSVGFSTVGKTFQAGEPSVGAGVHAFEDLQNLNYADDQWGGAYDDTNGKVWAYNSWMGYAAYYVEGTGWVLRTGNSGQIGSRSRGTVVLFKDGVMYLLGGGGYTMTRYNPTTNVITTNVGPATPDGVAYTGAWADDAKTAVLMLASSIPYNFVAAPAGSGYTYDVTMHPENRKFYRYDWVAQTFTELTLPAGLGSWVSNVVRVGGYLYVLNGWTYPSNNLTYPGTWSDGVPNGVLFRYDIANNTWTQMPGVHPRPTESPALWYADGKLWSAGGDDNGDVNGNNYVSEMVASYDLTAQAWTVEAPLSHQASGMGVIMQDTAVTYLVGGWNDPGDLASTVRATMRPNTPPGTVWFQWKPLAGLSRITTELTPAPSWLHTLDVYTGGTLASLTRIGGYTGSQPSKYEFTADGNTVYYMRVYSWDSQRSDGVMTVMGTAGTITTDPSIPLDFWFQQMTQGSDGYPLRQDALTTSVESPGSVQVRVGNVAVGQVVEFYVASAGVETYMAEYTVLTVGGLVASVPIEVSAPGSYTLIARVPGAELEGSLTFTVTSASTPGQIGVDVPTPPPAVQPTSGVRRWVFQDPREVVAAYTMHINPNEMSSPFGVKHIEYTGTTAIDGNKLAFEGQMPPVEWTWSGVILEKAHYDALSAWYALDRRVWLTDHYGRAWLIYITKFDPKPKRSPQYPWRHEYAMTALVFFGPVQQP